MDDKLGDLEVTATDFHIGRRRPRRPGGHRYVVGGVLGDLEVDRYGFPYW